MFSVHATKNYRIEELYLLIIFSVFELKKRVLNIIQDAVNI
jgi:hypothetical protein